MATINYLTTIEFDFGAVERLADIAAVVGIRRHSAATNPHPLVCEDFETLFKQALQ